MKALKYLLYALAGVIVLVIVRGRDHRRDLRSQRLQAADRALVKDKTGRTLAIEGDIGLKLFPKIGAEVRQGVAVGARAAAAEFAGVEQAQIYLSLLPLLRARWWWTRCGWTDCAPTSIKYKDGSDQLRAISTGGAEKAEPGGAAAPAQPRRQADPARCRAACASPTRALPGSDETNGNDLVIEVGELKTGRIAEKIAEQDRAQRRDQGRAAEGWISRR